MVRERVWWLGTPWFLGLVGLLVLNDHVLKVAWPGLVTGKLSDVAGLLVVATVLAVLVGRRWGVTLAGAAFVALKTVPGVSEAVSPLLGGPTLRDATDLVALAGLPVLWYVLHPVPAPPATATRRNLAVVGLVAALFATTATSPTPDSVKWLGFVDGAFYAETWLQPGKTVWLRSTDGGATWAAALPPSATPAPERVREGPLVRDGKNPMVRGTQACADDGVCYRSIQVSTPAGVFNNDIAYRIDRREPGQDWVPESDHGGDVPIAVNLSDSNQAIAIGVYRAPAGDWRVMPLLDIARAVG